MKRMNSRAVTRWTREPTFARPVLLAMLLLCAHQARASTCTLSIEADDMVQFNAQRLEVDAACTEVALTLRHVGTQQAHVLGHDWVLARSSDVAALASAGSAAGFEQGYLPAGDPRIIAATPIVGGGEAATITFSTAALVPGVQYSYFCSYPGHLGMMRGQFLFTAHDRVASNASP